MVDILVNLYYLSLFIFLLPSLNLGFIYSHGIAKLLLIAIFIYLVYQTYRKKIILQANIKLSALFMLFFLSQSLSVIQALDTTLYFSSFKKLIFILLFYFASLFILKTEKDRRYIIKVLFTVLLINILLQIIIFLFPNFFLAITEKILNPGYYGLIKMNINRGRVFLEEYNEVMIPPIVYLLIRGGNKKLFLLLLTVTIIVSYISGFRTKFAMTVFSLLTSFVVLLFTKIKATRNILNMGLLFTAVLSIFGLLYFYISQISPYSLVDRFMFQSEIADVQSVTRRIENWNEAIMIGLSSPIFGVGMGNYNYYANTERRITSFISMSKETKAIKEDLVNPHNLLVFTFAETGFFGLICLLLLLIYFIFEDIKVIIQGNDLSKAFIISFWCLFIYSLFNPTVNITYNILFWALRVFIYYEGEGINRRSHVGNK